MFYPRSEGPPSGGVPEGGARPAFPRLHPQCSLGRCGNRYSGITTRLRGARCTMPRRKCQGTEARNRIRKSPVERREARVPDRKGARGASHAPRHVASEEHTSELQSLRHLVCRLLLEKKKQ